MQNRFLSFLIYGTRVSIAGLFLLFLISLLIFLLNLLGFINLIPLWFFLVVSCYLFISFSVLYSILVPLKV